MTNKKVYIQTSSVPYHQSKHQCDRNIIERQIVDAMFTEYMERDIEFPNLISSPALTMAQFIYVGNEIHASLYCQ